MSQQLPLVVEHLVRPMTPERCRSRSAPRPRSGPPGGSHDFAESVRHLADGGRSRGAVFWARPAAHRIRSPVRLAGYDVDARLFIQYGGKTTHYSLSRLCDRLRSGLASRPVASSGGIAVTAALGARRHTDVNRMAPPYTGAVTITGSEPLS